MIPNKRKLSFMVISLAIDVYKRQQVDWTLNQFEEEFLGISRQGKIYDYWVKQVEDLKSTGHIGNGKAYEIPEATRTAKGTPAVNFLNLMQRERITAVIPIQDFSEDKYLMAVTKNGTIKKTALSSFDTSRKTGLLAVSYTHLINTRNWGFPR